MKTIFGLFMLIAFLLCVYSPPVNATDNLKIKSELRLIKDVGCDLTANAVIDITFIFSPDQELTSIYSPILEQKMSIFNRPSSKDAVKIDFGNIKNHLYTFNIPINNLQKNTHYKMFGTSSGGLPVLYR